MRKIRILVQELREEPMLNSPELMRTVEVLYEQIVEVDNVPIFMKEISFVINTEATRMT